jgi:hypothetical protein
MQLCWIRCAKQNILHACPRLAAPPGGCYAAWRGRAAHSQSRPVNVLHDAGSVPDRALALRCLQES